MKKRYWHYTVFQHLLKIIDCSAIKTASKGIDFNEIPAVWFSTNPIWEETVRKNIIDDTDKETGPFSRDELFKRGWPPIRIEANPDRVKLYSWNNYKKNSGAHPTTIKGLVKLSKSWGANPKEWYVSYEEVPLAHCLEPVEIWDGNNWVDIESQVPM